jgi:hypothetical protein
MKQLHIWVFCISLFGFLDAYGQATVSSTQELTTIVQDSLIIEKKTPISLRFGLDLYRLGMSQFNSDYQGFEGVADLRIKKDFYLAMEIGNEETTKESEQVNFTTSGTYLKLGFDYNMYENWLGMNNLIHLGLRFGSSRHNQFLNSYTILDRDRFWPGAELPISSGFATGERSNLNALWMEVVVGFKVQILNNIYLGFSLRLNRLFSDKEPENFDNIFIPGFNKKTVDNKFGAGINYTLTYNIPFRFKKGD